MPIQQLSRADNSARNELPELICETNKNWVGNRSIEVPSPENGTTALAGRVVPSGQADRLSEALKQLPDVGGEIFGFRLVSLLGRGAFGRVYLAMQSELAGRPVALKVSADLSGDGRALAQLQHTNIVPIYSMHRSGLLQGVCMPYFGQTTIADLLKRYREKNQFPATGQELVATLQDLSKPTFQSDEKGSSNSSHEISLPSTQTKTDSILALLSRESYVRAICVLVARLADGLAHAHERGLLHRDIKPGNVLLTDYGQPMLLDFGIAEDLKLRSRIGCATVGGTLPYMAPEHLQEILDNRSHADARSDIYSLGIILYELLTGLYPFRIPSGTTEQEVPKLIQERISTIPKLCKHRRDITPSLESIVRTCLQPDPARRYASAADLRDDLERYLAYLPLKVAPEPSYRERVSNWSRRHAFITSYFSIGTICFTMLGAGAYGYHKHSQRLERLEAEQSFHAFETSAPSAQYMIYSGAAHPKLLDQGLQQTQAILDSYGVGQPDWEQHSLFAALPIERQVDLRKELAEMCMMMARGVSVKNGTEEEKQQALHEATRWNLLAESVAKTAPRAVYSQRAKILKKLGLEEEAKQATEKANDPQSNWSAADHNLEGNELLTEKKYAEALKHYRRALQKNPKLFWAHIGEGACFVGLEKYSEARGSYNAAIALWPEGGWAHYNRGVASLQLQDADSALEDFQKAMEVLPEFGDLFWQRAQAYKLKNRAAEGLADLKEAVRLGVLENKIVLLRSELHALAGDAESAKRDWETALGEEPSDAAGWVIRGRARLSISSEDALADFNKALELEPKSFHALMNKAYVLKSMEKYEASLAVWEQAVDVSPESPYALAGRGLLYARFKKWDLALADAKKALAADSSSQIVYQVAAIYARTSVHAPEYRARALDLVTVAVLSGMSKEFLANDAEFAAIQDAKEFQQLIKK